VWPQSVRNLNKLNLNPDNFKKSYIGVCKDVMVSVSDKRNLAILSKPFVIFVLTFVLLCGKKFNRENTKYVH